MLKELIYLKKLTNQALFTMTEIENLKSGQSTLHNEMLAHAIKLGSENEPIFDGVCDPERYLKSKIKVMWILKEAYDDFDKNDNPIGGGWKIYQSWDQDPLKASKSSTWQPIMYVLRALAENNKWDDIAWIWDEREEYLEYLKSCAYINVNKMPGDLTSGDLSKEFEDWKEIISKQIKLYDPNIIIFGNTYKYFQNEDYICSAIETKGVPGAVRAYITNVNGKKIILIDAYHPNQRSLTRQHYVDSILESYRMNCSNSDDI